MVSTPALILRTWLRGLLALAIIAGAIYCFRAWYRELPSTERVVVTRSDGYGAIVERPIPASERIAAWRPAADRATAFLVCALSLTLWATCGRFVNGRLLRSRGDDEPRAERTGEVRRLRRPDGTELHVELYGPADAQPIVFNHGWGIDSTIWYYAKRELADRYRLILWDLPAAGLSSRPANRDFSLEKMADDFRAVLLECAGDRPATVVCHSIGGMIFMTFARLFPELVTTRVAAVVIAHSTYVNPLRTTSGASIYTLLQKPLIEPLLHLTIWLSPLVWIMNWLSYWNGSAHRSTAKSSFAGTETREQLDFAAAFTVKMSPADQARGCLGMLRYDASDVRAGGIPALVVVGDRDPETKPEAGERLRSQLSGDLETLTPARHFGMFEHHGRFARRVRELCETVAPVAASNLRRARSF